MSNNYDVIVVGAGPSGAATAKKCVDGGLKTLLIDKHKLPRRKACSGIICNETQNYLLENFGPVPEKTFAQPYAYRGMGIYFPSVGMIYSETDCYNLYVWRDKFDHWLAKSSGADLQDQTYFLSAEDKGNGVEVAISRNNKQQIVKAEYIIGADGANSHVVRNLAPDSLEDLPWVFACQKYFEGEIDADDRYLHWYLTTGMGPFPWLNIKDNQIIIGQALNLGEKFKPNFLNFIEFLKNNFNLKIKKELATEGCNFLLRAPLNRFFPGRNRLLTVGDASGLIHQGGEGISCALVSGGYAGEAIIQALKTNREALPIYKKLIRPEMETSLDQFNLLRMMSTGASDNSRQPPFFQGLSLKQKALAMKDFMTFLKEEMFALDQGYGPTVMKNMIYRKIFGKYKIPAVD